MTDIHSCSYYCDRPACIKAQRDELRERLALPEQEQEPMAWRNAAIRVGEDLCSVGPFGYYDMTAQQWLDWALSVVTVHAPPQPAQQPEQEPVAWLDGPHLVVRLDMRNRLNYQGPWVDLGRAIPDKWTPFLYTAPPQRKPLTEEQAFDLFGISYNISVIRAVEAAHGIKENT